MIGRLGMFESLEGLSTQRSFFWEGDGNIGGSLYPNRKVNGAWLHLQCGEEKYLLPGNKHVP